MYKLIVRPFFFLFDPEKIHHFTFSLIAFAGKIPFVRGIFRWIYQVKDPSLEREFFGIKFKNPVGLAAGFDKDARIVDELSDFGFGFIEIGTLTPVGQPGNSRPRLFRLPRDKAIINRMGFNNQGARDAARRLSKRRSNVIVGGNIGKNKITPNEEASEDYLASFDELYQVVDYFVVNVSSPNTPNLRELQDKVPLTNLLKKIQERNNTKEKRKPVLLKIAPDLTSQQLRDIVSIIKETKLDGVIAANTTVSRENLVTETSVINDIGAGGLSGQPVFDKSNEVIEFLRERLGPAFPIIGVGGIMSPQDALYKLKCGASLIQVYTGFIYEGPGFIKRINKYLKNQSDLSEFFSNK